MVRNQMKKGGKKHRCDYVLFHELRALLLPRLGAENIEQPEHIADLLFNILSECCAGKTFYIPKATHKSRQMLSERNSHIMALYDSGVSAADIAHRYRLRETYVLALIRRL